MLNVLMTLPPNTTLSHVNSLLEQAQLCDTKDSIYDQVNTLQTMIKTQLAPFILSKQCKPADRKPRSLTASYCNLKESSIKLDVKPPTNQVPVKLLNAENTKFIAQVFRDYEKSMQQVETLS